MKLQSETIDKVNDKDLIMVALSAANKDDNKYIKHSCCEEK